MSQHLQPDLALAQRHLTLLDEGAETFVFQTFDDDKKRKEPSLARTLHGTLEQHKGQLLNLSKRGAGIFITLNCSSNGRRTKPDIDGYRVIFREADKPGLPPLPLEPHFVLQSSPGKRHEYLLIGRTEDHDTWGAIMQTMVDEYGSDPNAKDRSRVLRLAGFPHQKDPANPHMVTIVHESGAQPYTMGEVAKHIKPTVKAKERPAATVKGASTNYGQKALDSEIAELSATPEGSRNAQLNKTAFSLGQLVAGGELDQDQVEVSLMAAAVDIGLNESEARQTVKSGMGSGGQKPRTAPNTEGSLAKGANGAKSQAGHGNTPGLKLGEVGLILDEGQVKGLMDKAKKHFAPVGGGAVGYPVEALGVLADACKVISEEGQLSQHMAGQCLITTAALLVQSVANVRTLAGIKPLSLYALTEAESGEGKSTAEEAAQRQIIECQKLENKRYRFALDMIKQIPKKKNDDPPDVPREPYRIMKDCTVEGIRRAFRDGIPSQGAFSSEAAVMLAGYGMNPDHRAKSAGNFNGIWDNGEISVARGSEGRLQLYDRRFSIHWLVQPDVATTAIHDPLLSNIGFWPRFLLSCPPPSPPLKAKRFCPENFSAVRDYWKRCKDLLDLSLGEDCSDIQTIEATPEAEQLAKQFFERMQVAAKTEGGILTGIKPFAVRATEQAFRIAGVMAVFSGQSEIDLGVMRDGITLAAHSLESWRVIFTDQAENQARAAALALYSWLLKQPGCRGTETAMITIGPKPRSASRRDTSLSLLQQAGLVDCEYKTWSVILDKEATT